MTAKRVFLIHATPLSMALITEAFHRLWPEAQLSNLLDDSLPKDLAAAGRLTEGLTARFLDLARYAEAAGADAILFTCSAFGTAIEACKHAVSIPVLKPNEAMIDDALRQTSRIALMATFEPSIGSMLEEFNAAALALGRVLDINAHWVPGAFGALQAGDGETHDVKIAEMAKETGNCEVICFAQFSMTSAAHGAQAASGRPVLTTPDSAVIRLRKILDPLR